jgi:hypothetical protein
MKLITATLEERFKEIGDQSESKNPLIVVKLFDPAGSATWYATEYDAERKVAFGFVTGLHMDQWGSFSIKELEAIERPFGLTIERDIYFEEQRYFDVFKDQKRIAELAQIERDKIQIKELAKENEQTDVLDI